MNNAPIRIILVDDHELVRKSWKNLLETNPRFHIVADYESGDSAIEQTLLLVPDIMLVDINMSPLNGFTVAEKMLEKLPGVKIIGLSIHNQPRYAGKMIELGAKGYITKTSSLEEVNHGILEVYKGKIYICEEVRKYMPQSENGVK